MNKKAFTLTETLGVIVILSIIALIAIPALTTSQGKSDAAYYENLKNLVTIAGKDYFSDHRTLLPANKGSTNFVKLETLTKLDYIEQPVSTKKNACIGYVQVTKADRFDYLTCLKCDDYISDSRCDFENGGGGSTVADEYLTVSPTYFEVGYGDPFNPPYAQYYSNGELVRSDIGANPAYIDTTVLTTYTLNYYYRNANPVSIQVKVIDDIPPSKVNVVMRKDSIIGGIYTSGWTSSNIYQIFTATDNESGIKGYEYSFVNQPNNNAVWTFTNKNTITQTDLIKKLGSGGTDISKTVYVRAVDNFENRGPVSSYSLSVDQTKPVKPTIYNPTNENWTNKDFSLTVSSSDNMSGIAYYTYTYNANLSGAVRYANSATNQFVTTPFSAERNQYVYIQACNNAGLCSDAAKTMIRIDKTRPTVSYSIPGGDYRETKQVTVTANDANFNYMNVHVYKNGQLIYSKSTNNIKSRTYTVNLDSQGGWAVYTQVYDGAGNMQNQNPDNGSGWFYQNYIIVLRVYCDGYHQTAPVHSNGRICNIRDESQSSTAPVNYYRYRYYRDAILYGVDGNCEYAGSDLLCHCASGHGSGYIPGGPYGPINPIHGMIYNYNKSYYSFAVCAQGWESANWVTVDDCNYANQHNANVVPANWGMCDASRCSANGAQTAPMFNAEFSGPQIHDGCYQREAKTENITVWRWYYEN